MDTMSLDDQRGRQCNVCYHAFSREGEHVPRILSCGHTYCTACLSKLVGKFSRGKVCCPTCKTDTSIPGLVNNVQKLAKNFAVLDILEGLEEAFRSSSVVTNQMLLCNEHDNEPKKVYCLTDSMVICIYCQVYGPHKGHECQLVSQVASNNREILSQMQDDLTAQKKTLLPAWRHIQDISNTVQLREEKLMREVRQHFDTLRRKLCRREKEVTGHLKSLTSGKVVVLHKQCRRIGELMDRVEQLKMACQSFISGPDYEIVLKMDSLKHEINTFKAELPNHDLGPCARNNLVCDLPHDLQKVIAAHGAIVECEDPEQLESLSHKPTGAHGYGIQNQDQQQDQQQDQSQAVTETSYSGPSGDDTETVDAHWQNSERATVSGQRNQHSTNRPRQRLQRPDVIIFDSVGDLDEIDPSVCQVRPLCQCHGDGSRGRCDLYVHSGRRRLGQRDPSQNEEDTFQDVSDASSDTSSSSVAASPDFSDVSDLELDLPLRSAWSNGGGWSSPHPTSSSCQDQTSVRVSVREVVAEMERTGDDAEEVGAVGGQNHEAPLSSDEATSRNPVESQGHTTETGCARPISSHVHPRSYLDLKCSVFNCSSQAASAVYVRCKHCNRVFCQNCVHHSSSARRCYKRPRGHSFVLISHPSISPTSSNNNNCNMQSVPQARHRHRRHHHGYNHQHHHHQSGGRHQHYSSSRRRHHHHHHHQHSSHHHENQVVSQQHHHRRDYRRSRTRGQHRSGGQECEEGHVRVQREGHHTCVMERMFEDLII